MTKINKYILNVPKCLSKLTNNLSILLVYLQTLSIKGLREHKTQAYYFLEFCIAVFHLINIGFVFVDDFSFCYTVLREYCL